MPLPLTAQKLREIHGDAANLPIWVVCPDDPDVCILTTIGEYWARHYEDSLLDWERIFSEGP
jgi:hypothetical protein